jgi:hypothetical protein
MHESNCIFCGVTLTESRLNRPDSRTREHVYAKWFRGVVVNNKIKMFSSDGKTDTFHEQTELEDFWNRSVCGNCNNGWMSVLEQTVSPVFEKLTNGVDLNLLTPGEIETLARWAGKTAIVLGYLMPYAAIVPEFIRRTFVPGKAGRPCMHLFYQLMDPGKTLEGGYVHLWYGEEFAIVGRGKPSGLRFTLCVYNHLLTVDFPPMPTGIRYDLSDSVSAEVWPSRIAAGTTDWKLTFPATIGAVLFRVCEGVHAVFDADAFGG